MTDLQVYTNKKLVLISYCEQYGKASHIRSRKLFKSYKFSLMEDEGLSKKQWSHLVSYLRYDLYQSEEKLTEHFKDFIRCAQPYEEQPATLY